MTLKMVKILLFLIVVIKLMSCRAWVKLHAYIYLSIHLSIPYCRSMMPQSGSLRPNTSPFKLKINPLRPEISILKLKAFRLEIGPIRFEISLVRTEISSLRAEISPFSPEISFLRHRSLNINQTFIHWFVHLSIHLFDCLFIPPPSLQAPNQPFQPLYQPSRLKSALFSSPT